MTQLLEPEDAKTSAVKLSIPPAPVKSNFMRRLIDQLLEFDVAQAQALRICIRDATPPPDEFKTGFAGLRYALLSISEKKPHILIAGIVSWSYFVVYAVLKMTILV